MSVLCSICQDFLTERPQGLAPSEEAIMVALICGHLFHMKCLRQWFRSFSERPGWTNRNPDRGECPCCKKASSVTTCIRIYPTGDEDSNTVVQLKKNMEQAINGNQALAVEVSKLKDALGQISGEFEDEIISHDMLKMEYGETLSRVDFLQEQLNETKTMKTVMENSYKSQLDKLEKDKMDAMATIRAQEEQINKLQADLSQNKENSRSLLTGIQSMKRTLTSLHVSTKNPISNPGTSEGDTGRSSSPPTIDDGDSGNDSDCSCTSTSCNCDSNRPQNRPSVVVVFDSRNGTNQ